MKYKQLAKFLAHNSFSPLLAMLLALSSLHAFAGGNVENGGDGVIDGSTVYSLDLVERGLERSPFVGEDIPVPQEVQTLVDKFLQNKVPSDTAAILARKVARMKANHEAALYRSVRKVLDSYTLVMIQAPLKIVDDQDSPIDNRAITRVAAHSADDQAIQVNLNGFSAMDPQNQAALLTHEIIYASATDKTSRPSRNIAATLFDPAFKTDSLDVRYRVAQKRFFGQACLNDPGQRVCTLDQSNLEVIYRGELGAAYIDQYSQAIPQDTLNLLNGNKISFVSPALETSSIAESPSGRGYLMLLLGQGKFFVGANYFESDGMLQAPDCVFEKDISGSSTPAVEQNCRVSADWKNSTSAGKISVVGNALIGVSTNGKTKIDLHLLQLPNGKFVWIWRLARAEFISPLKYSYVSGLLAKTKRSLSDR